MPQPHDKERYKGSLAGRDRSTFPLHQDSGPSIVNAALNSATNRFDVTNDNRLRKERTRSKFDFSNTFYDQSTAWTLDSQYGWDSAPAYDQTAWGDSFEPEVRHKARFSHKDNEEGPTFRLNFEIPDKPIFSEVVDYASIRDRPIVPTAEDIFENSVDDFLEEEASERKRLQPLPNVPINRVKGAYGNVEQYLYTHFELMRRDCLIPLQEAVRSYRRSLASGKDSSVAAAMGEEPVSSRDFRLYEQVGLNALVFGPRKVFYRITFRLPYYVRVKWEQSKRLLEGTLVLLSKDDFKSDLKIATVTQRGEVPMKGSNRFEYMIDVYLERDNEGMPLGFGDPCLMEKDKYVMIEATSGYFEAYRHILSVFQSVTPSDLPFAKYLVNISKDVRLPHYAAQKRYYDISLYRGGRGSKASKMVDITDAWPTYEIGMDKTQMDALKTILSNNIAIVQGPPGTGKTFVGTYAMRVLLNTFPDSSAPIICICQTNHALDQFLEHILDFDDRIVRIGSRSKSDLLKDHLLYELRKQAESVRGIGRLFRKREEIKEHIQEIITEMYEEPCVSLDFLKKINALTPRQLDSLKRLGECEEKRQISEAAKKLEDDDDDEWVISSDTSRAIRAPSPPPKGRSKKKGNDRKSRKEPNDRAEGNPNLKTEDKKETINPVEVWLKDAIEYVDSSGVMYNFAEEMKEDLLEQQKGLVFEEDFNEDEFIDEDEVQEFKLNYTDEPDLRGNKNQFINIGEAYKKQSSKAPKIETLWGRVVEGRDNMDNQRKIVNYKKIQSARTFDTQKFNFFEETVDESALEPQHYVLERWMKEEPDITLWPLPVRLKAHKRWVEQRNKELAAAVRQLMARYEDVSREIQMLNVQRDAAICRKHRVVGMTSTAAAKYHDLLDTINPRIMVVEEAAEMLESHIISAMTQSLQHLVLIGDHQQLRPQTSVHTLAERHYLNVSLFERLVMNDLPYTRLSHQRRMRPEIRMLINPIYSDPPLEDHPDVFKYPPVRGMEESLFFLSHNEPETHMADSASKCNEHEAAMAAKLSTYLLLQGYSPDEITIITMYGGQRALIKRKLREERRPDLDPSCILVSSVDGYQGEENKIIILSLVRSNSSGSIGFLKVANRVCVSLSRAQHGMYILGNASLLCQQSDLWNEIVSNLEDHASNKIGVRLKLRCTRHNQITEVQWPVDFATIPEGGCTRPCGELLSCGHRCGLPCHPYDHDEVHCQEPCRQIMEGCGHQCTRRCWENCGSCLKTISLRLPCSHEVEGECGRLRRAMANPAGIRCPTCYKV